jgi:hypothetical protein
VREVIAAHEILQVRGRARARIIVRSDDSIEVD